MKAPSDTGIVRGDRALYDGGRPGFRIWTVFLLLLLCVITAGCSGGRSSGGSTVLSYQVGGTISGLSGTVVLQLNDGSGLERSQNGGFIFPGRLTNGAAYEVTVLTQPRGQSCSVLNGAGTVNNGNVAVAVACTNNTYTVGGTISGLSGSVVMQNNGGDDLTVSTDGDFTFAAPVAHGGAYAVTVLTHPAGHACIVSNGSGTIDAADVADVTVACRQDPELALIPEGIKTFRFTWTDIAGRTEYRLLEDPDGVSGYTEIASIAPGVENHEIEVFLPARIDARYILEFCDAGGCEDSLPVSVTGTLAEAIGYVKASNTGVNDEFGYSVALSADGSTLAVGARFERSGAVGIDGDQDDDSAENSGAVYVFARAGDGLWGQQAYIKASNTGLGDEFGHSIALSADGNTLAVGAYRESSSAVGIGDDQDDDSAPNSGAVYVFTRSGDAWSQQAYVKASNTEANDQFGFSVALSGDGDTLAVGALFEDSAAIGIDGDQGSNAAANSGAVYVFARSGAAWTQQAYIKASNAGANDQFGHDVALSDDGNTLAVGAYLEDSAATGVDNNQASNAAPDSGAVYVFTRSGIAWTQQAYVKASNTGSGDQFGYSVALSGDGDTLAVGALFEDSAATGIDGDQGSNAAVNSGAVYVFARSGAAWTQQAYVKASNTETNDQFGFSVALSGDGDILAAGAFAEDSNAMGINGNQVNNAASSSGAVYVFTRSSGLWRQQAYVKAPNTETSDVFGDRNGLALSADGGTMAVGAPLEDSGATGIGGDQADNTVSGSGAVYLY